MFVFVFVVVSNNNNNNNNNNNSPLMRVASIAVSNNRRTQLRLTRIM
jgi:hypothetical protein